MGYILGLDVSYAQGNITDLMAARNAGYDFMLIRMSYAYPGQDPKFDTKAARNYQLAIAAGFITGGYHKIGWTDPIVEADFFLKAMSPLADGDLLAYDKEPNSDVPIPPNWSEWEQAFVQRIHDQTGVWPFDYSNISMYNAMPREGVIVNCAPWVAAPDYSWDAALPVKDVVMLQQGPTVQVPGIPDNVTDTDAFFGTKEQLLSYAFKTPQPTPEPTPQPSDPTPAPVSQPTPPTVPETPPVAPADTPPVVQPPEPTPQGSGTPPEPNPVVTGPATPVPASTDTLKKTILALITAAAAALVAVLKWLHS